MGDTGRGGLPLCSHFLPAELLVLFPVWCFLALSRPFSHITISLTSFPEGWPLGTHKPGCFLLPGASSNFVCALSVYIGPTPDPGLCPPWGSCILPSPPSAPGSLSCKPLLAHSEHTLTGLCIQLKLGRGDFSVGREGALMEAGHGDLGC